MPKNVSGIFGAWYDPNSNDINSCAHVQLLISFPVYFQAARRLLTNDDIDRIYETTIPQDLRVPTLILQPL
jgi:hypothetical protein